MAKLQYKDDKGNIGEGQSMTDLSRNNILIKRGIKVLWYFAGLLTAFFLLVIWLIVYVLQNNVVNNIVNACI